MNWGEIWGTIKDFFSSNGWNIIKVFSILFIGIIIIKLVINITKRVLNRTNLEKIGVQFFIGIIKVVLYLFLILLIFKVVGIEITGIMTAVSAIVLAIGVALENNIANFANGIVIVSTKMFSKGDYIIVNGVEGSISDINLLFTTLITPDNRRITIPNSTIVNNPVTNNGAYKIRRVQITFSVAYESDVELVKKVVTDVMKSNGKVYLNKDIFCRLKTMSASSLDFYSYCWVDKEDYWSVYYYLMENVYNEFKRNGITVPFQQVEVRNRTDEVEMPVVGKGLPPRVEKIRQIKNKFDLEEVDFVELIKKSTSKDNKKTRKKKKTSNSKNDAMDKAIEKSIAKKSNEINTKETNGNQKIETEKETNKKDESLNKTDKK